MPVNDEPPRTREALTAATGLPAHVLRLAKMPVELQALTVSVGSVFALLTSRPAEASPRQFLISSLRELAALHPPTDENWNGVYFGAWLQILERSDGPVTPSKPSGSADQVN
jgi:hypothetical protein